MRSPVRPWAAQVRGVDVAALTGWLGVIAFSALVVIVFAPYAAAGFVGTDVLTSIETSRVHSLGDVLKLWLSPFGDGSMFVRSDALIYRPVVAMLFALDYALWGMDPTGYHLTNTLLHLLAALATLAFLRGMGLARAPALLGAALVAFHPGMAGAVPVLSRRHDPVCSCAAARLLRAAAAQPARAEWVLAHSVRRVIRPVAGREGNELWCDPIAAARHPRRASRPTEDRSRVRADPCSIRGSQRAPVRAAIHRPRWHRRPPRRRPAAGHRPLSPGSRRVRTQLLGLSGRWYPERTVGWAALAALVLPALALAIACLPRRERLVAALGWSGWPRLARSSW